MNVGKGLKGIGSRGRCQGRTRLERTHRRSSRMQETGSVEKIIVLPSVSTSAAQTASDAKPKWLRGVSGRNKRGTSTTDNVVHMFTHVLCLHLVLRVPCAQLLVAPQSFGFHGVQGGDARTLGARWSTIQALARLTPPSYHGAKTSPETHTHGCVTGSSENKPTQSLEFVVQHISTKSSMSQLLPLFGKKLVPLACRGNK